MHKINVKNKIIIILICILVLSVCVFAVTFNSDSDVKGVCIGLGNHVNNDHHNIIAGGNLTRLNDDLYYNYENSDGVYSVVKLNDEYSKVLYTDKKHIKPHPPLYEPLRIYKQKVTTRFYNKSIEQYIDKSNKWSGCSDFNKIPDISLDFYFNGTEYIYSRGNDIERELIYRVDDVEKVICNNLQCFDVQNNAVYFSEADKTNKKCFIKKFDISTKEVTLLYDTPYIEINKLLFGNDIIVVLSDKIYSINLNNGEKTLDEINLNVYDVNSCNLSDNTLYIASSKGLYKYDILHNTAKKLISDYAFECYVVDDKHIFFTDRSNALWKLELKSNNLKKIYPVSN